MTMFPRALRRAVLKFESRVRFAEEHLRDRFGNRWHVRGYQRASLESRATRKVHCSGRDVGKTTELEIVSAWASVCRPGRQMLVATQHEAHLAPLMRRLLHLFERTPRLQRNLERVRQSPAWHIEFKNGFQLFGRIAGVGASSGRYLSPMEGGMMRNRAFEGPKIAKTRLSGTHSRHHSASPREGRSTSCFERTVHNSITKEVLL